MTDFENTWEKNLMHACRGFIAEELQRRDIKHGQLYEHGRLKGLDTLLGKEWIDMCKKMYLICGFSTKTVKAPQ